MRNFKYIYIYIYIYIKLEIKNDDMVADVAQCEYNKIKCYASVFSNI